ncbi:MAG: lysostaphin resistance A-like protein [Candidatus Sigynarchaeota archaeon]
MYPPIDDDLFETNKLSPEDLVDSKIRNEVSFDIEVSAESNKKIAYEFLANMYKKHFWALFIGSIVAFIVLLILISFLGTIQLFGGLVIDIRLVMGAGLLAIPISVLVLMPLLERNVYARDPWTLERLGIQPLTSSYSKNAYLAGLLPLVLLLIKFIDSTWGLNPMFINPLYVFVVVGGIPIVIFEEVIFRGVYWKYIMIRYAKTNSVKNVYIINALLFTAIHMPRLFIAYSGSVLGNTLMSQLPFFLQQIAIYFVAGLLLSILRDAFNSLLAPVSYHLVFNTILFTLVMDGWWILLFIAITLLVVILALKMEWLKLARAPTNLTMPSEYNKNVLETRLHAILRLAFLLGNGLVLFYYGSEMSWGNPLLFLISSIIIIASFALVGYLYVKRIWFFKLPSR